MCRVLPFRGHKCGGTGAQVDLRGYDYEGRKRERWSGPENAHAIAGASITANVSDTVVCYAVALVVRSALFVLSICETSGERDEEMKNAAKRHGT